MIRQESLIHYEGIGNVHDNSGNPVLAIESYNQGLFIAQQYNYGFEKLDIVISKEIIYAALGIVDKQVEMLEIARGNM